MKVTVIQIVIDALGRIPKELEKGLDGLEIRRQVGTIQKTALSRSARIMRRVLTETCYHSKSSVKLANAGVTGSQRNRMTIIIINGT